MITHRRILPTDYALTMTGKMRVFKATQRLKSLSFYILCVRKQDARPAGGYLGE
jgi:hypothetical protein